MQNRQRHGNDNQIVFFVYDILYYGGHDLRHVALIARKQFLAQLFGGKRQSQIIRYNDHIIGQGAQVFSNACRHGLEGIVAKRADSHYIGRRTSDWVKVKCSKRQEFVIGGWTDPDTAENLLAPYWSVTTADPANSFIAGVWAPDLPSSHCATCTKHFKHWNKRKRRFAIRHQAAHARGDPLDQAQAGGRGGVCRLDSGWNVTSCFLSRDS